MKLRHKSNPEEKPEKEGELMKQDRKLGIKELMDN